MFNGDSLNSEESEDEWREAVIRRVDLSLGQLMNYDSMQ